MNDDARVSAPGNLRDIPEHHNYSEESGEQNNQNPVNSPFSLNPGSVAIDVKGQAKGQDGLKARGAALGRSSVNVASIIRCTFGPGYLCL